MNDQVGCPIVSGELKFFAKNSDSEGILYEDSRRRSLATKVCECLLNNMNNVWIWIVVAFRTDWNVVKWKSHLFL